MRFTIINRAIFNHFIKSTLLMSLFYQVMGTQRCPKIKKHLGLKIKPITKTKEPYTPGDLILFDCESNETKQTLKCLDDGRWNDMPICPDPSNHTCPSLEPIANGQANSTGPFKVGAVVAFKCENEIDTNPIITNLRKPKELKAPEANEVDVNQQPATLMMTTTDTMLSNTNPTSIPTTTITTPKPYTQSSMNPQLAVPIPLNMASLPSFINQGPNQSSEQLNFIYTRQQQQQQQPQESTTRYNLTGHRVLKCLPSSRWNHPQPTCAPIFPESASNLSLVLTSICLISIPVLIFIGIIQLFLRWKKRQQQRERWKQYFTDYKYRHSKTSITFGMRPQIDNQQQSTNSNNNNTRAHSTTTTATNSAIPITDL